KYYRMKDIVDIGTEWVTIKKKGSDADIKEFKDRKMSETKAIMSHGLFCKAWELDQSVLNEKQKREMEEARRNAIFTRLEALGYDSRDVRDCRVTNSRHFHTSTPLTARRRFSFKLHLKGILTNPGSFKAGKVSDLNWKFLSTTQRMSDFAENGVISSGKENLWPKI
ncbi:hypothetical protein FRC00_013612, partial [Tulasnella sp. 408]